MKVKDFMLLTMMLLALPLCSCSSSDNGEEPVVEEEKPVATTLKMTIKATLPEDLFTVANVYLGYVDTQMKTSVEILTSPNVNKDITIPLSAGKVLGYCIVLQAKDLYEHEVDTYKVGNGSHETKWEVYDQKGQLMEVEIFSQSSSLTVGASNIGLYLVENMVLCDAAYQVTSAGKLEAKNLEWEVGFDTESGSNAPVLNPTYDFNNN